MNAEQMLKTVNGWVNDINPIAMITGCLVFMVLPPLWKRLRTPGEVSDTAKMVIRLLGESGWLDSTVSLAKRLNDVNYLVYFRGSAAGDKRGSVKVADNAIEPKLSRRDRKAIAKVARGVQQANVAAAKLAKENEVKALVAKSLSQTEPCSPPKPIGPGTTGYISTVGATTQWYVTNGLANFCKYCGVASTATVITCPICKKLKV